MAKKTIITAAVTGAWPKKENNPNVPLTPSEIAEDVYECWKAGAAVAHLHMRDCRLPRYLTKPRQRRNEWDMAGSDGISRVSAVFRGKSLLTNKMRII